MELLNYIFGLGLIATALNMVVWSISKETNLKQKFVSFITCELIMILVLGGTALLCGIS